MPEINNKPSITSWSAQAPTNIALIKYMGKYIGNMATNPSLSWTLPHLTTHVTMRLTDDLCDRWEPFEHQRSLPLHAQRRYLDHLSMLKKHLGCYRCFLVSSRNNFPANCGLASSASSFAALTKCALKAFQDCGAERLSKPMSTLDMAHLSRLGSGSSCRSFWPDFVLWDQEQVGPVELPYKRLRHVMVVIDTEDKVIPSSEAHRRVRSSLNFGKRVDRARARCDQLIMHLKQQNWKAAFYVMWHEFWDMHALFETSQPPFGYMQAGTFTVLDYLRQVWQARGDGPLVTIDAGPNIHLLFREDQNKLCEEMMAALGQAYAMHAAPEEA